MPVAKSHTVRGLNLLLRTLNRKRNGFTLLEIMIVVFIIGLLLAIAVPAFTHARDKARTKSCIKNLSHIETAKEQHALADGKSEGNSVSLDDLVPRYVKDAPECPAGGTYDLKPIGEDPTCTIEGHSL